MKVADCGHHLPSQAAWTMIDPRMTQCIAPVTRGARSEDLSSGKCHCVKRSDLIDSGRQHQQRSCMHKVHDHICSLMAADRSWTVLPHVFAQSGSNSI
eukprot:4433985-Amphidinium_carterae.1